MRTKKNKFINLLKTGVLLLSISLFLWNCEKDELITENLVTTNPNDGLSEVSKVETINFNQLPKEFIENYISYSCYASKPQKRMIKQL